jgi:hypothetical protein
VLRGGFVELEEEKVGDCLNGGSVRPCPTLTLCLKPTSTLPEVRFVPPIVAWSIYLYFSGKFSFSMERPSKR